MRSRFYYFRKHFGLSRALIVEFFNRFNKIIFLLALVTQLGLFLRTYRLSDLMPFIGDQAWFLLSARDFIQNGNFPLLGIPSSRPWLHQGPLWTYLITPVLFIFSFNPLSTAYLTAVLDTFTIVFIYLFSSTFYSSRIALFASVLYATSPLVISNSRFAYHTSPIPLFAILYLFCLFKTVQGKEKYFPVTFLFLGILYNLELATVPLFAVTILILIYGYFKKSIWFLKIMTKKTIFLSLVLLLISVSPILIYDFQHGFAQLGGFFIWAVYKFISSMYLLISGNKILSDSPNFIEFILINIQRLISIQSLPVSVGLLITSVIYFTYEVYKKLTFNNVSNPSFLILLCFFVLSAGLFLTQTPSSAYIPVFFPMIIIVLAVFLSRLSIIGLIILTFLVITNVYLFLANDFNFEKRNKFVNFTDRVDAAKRISSLASEKKYNLVGKEWLSDHPHYLLGYHYLTWWLGNEPSKKPTSIIIYVKETAEEIYVYK